MQLALAIRVFGYSIVAVRALAALYAILTCAVLLLAGRRMLGAGPALWAALVFTVAPITLANTRWGYSYAQLACIGVFCLWAGWRYAESGERRWLLAAAALAGLAAFSDYVGVAWIVFVALLALRRAWRDAALAAGVGFGILAAGLLACLVAAPAIFVSDVVTTSGRAAGGNPLLQVILLLLNYYRFLTLDPWLLLGVVGLFLVPARTRGYLLGAAVVLGLVVLKVRDLGASIHTAVPLLPILALGAGVALDAGLRRLYAWSLDWPRPLIPASPTSSVSPASRSSDRHPDQPHPLLRRQVAALLVFLVVVSPLGLATAADAVGLGGTLTTRQDDTSRHAGRRAGRWALRARARPFRRSRPRLADHRLDVRCARRWQRRWGHPGRGHPPIHRAGGRSGCLLSSAPARRPLGLRCLAGPRPLRRRGRPAAPAGDARAGASAPAHPRARGALASRLHGWAIHRLRAAGDCNRAWRAFGRESPAKPDWRDPATWASTELAVIDWRHEHLAILFAGHIRRHAAFLL